MPAARQGRRLLVALAVLVVLAGAAVGALVLLLPPARVNELVRAQLARMMAREVRFESVSVGLWPPVRATVGGPVLAEPGGFAQGAAFRASAVHLDLDVWALLGHRVVVRRLELDDPVLHLVLHPDGTTNLDSLLKPQPVRRRERGPMDLRVNELRVKRGRLVLDQPASHRRSTLQLDTRLDFSARAGGTQYATRGESRLGGYAFGSDRIAVASGLNRSLAGLVLGIRHDGTFDTGSRRLALTRLEVELGHARIALAGTVDDPGPRARLALRARGAGVDFGDVLSFLAAADAKLVSGIRGSGRMSFDLGVGGALGPGRLPQLRGTVTVTGASLRYPKAKVPLERVNFVARFAPDAVEVGNLSAVVAGQPLRGTLGASRFADPLVRFALQGTLDLDAIAPMVAPKDTRLGGRVAVNVRGAGRAKDPGSMALDGRADLSGVSVASPTMPKPLEAVNGRVEFSPARAALHGLTGRAGKSSFTLEATATRPLAALAKAGAAAPAGISFRFDAPWLDAAELLPGGGGGVLPLNVSGGGSVRIGRFLNKKLQLTNVLAEIALQPNHVTVSSLSAGAYGGRLSGSGAFDLANPASPGFQLKGKVEALQADEFLSAFVPMHGMVDGVVTSTFDLAGAGTTKGQLERTLTAIGLASLAQGRIGGPALAALANEVRIPALRTLNFDQGRMGFRVVRGQIVTDSARFVGASCGEWRAAGAIGFDGRMDYAVSGTLPRELSDRIGARSALAAGALSDAEGRVLLDLRITGPVSAPRVTWDPRAMRERLAGRASQALREQSRSILEEVARRAAGAPAESAKSAPPDVKGELQRRANDIFQEILGRKRKAPAESAARESVRTAPRDTTRR